MALIEPRANQPFIGIPLGKATNASSCTGVSRALPACTRKHIALFILKHDVCMNAVPVHVY